MAIDLDNGDEDELKSLVAFGYIVYGIEEAYEELEKMEDIEQFFADCRKLTEICRWIDRVQKVAEFYIREG